jgi:hypothetical protein
VANLIIVISKMGKKSLEITKFSGKRNPQLAKSHDKQNHCLRHPGTMMAKHKPVSLNSELALCVG